MGRGNSVGLDTSALRHRKEFMIFYIADPHFGHKKIIEYDKRPFASVSEMNSELIRRWNNKVSKNDIVYCLGDFAFHMTEREIGELIDSLNGEIRFVAGNHDDLQTYYKLWQDIEVYREIKDDDRNVVLFHYPITWWNKKDYGAYHIYGHVHDMDGRQLNEPKAFNAFCGYYDYAPATLDEMIERHKNGTV